MNKNEIDKNKNVTAVTTTTIARIGHNNLRTSIPANIVRIMDIKLKDKIIWRYKNNNLTIEIEKQ